MNVLVILGYATEQVYWNRKIQNLNLHATKWVMQRWMMPFTLRKGPKAVTGPVSFHITQSDL